MRGVAFGEPGAFQLRAFLMAGLTGWPGFPGSWRFASSAFLCSGSNGENLLYCGVIGVPALKGPSFTEASAYAFVLIGFIVYVSLATNFTVPPFK